MLGAAVIMIHHTNRNGEARGSSDFKPASDQAFLVGNQGWQWGATIGSDYAPVRSMAFPIGLSAVKMAARCDASRLRVNPVRPSPSACANY